MRAVNSLFTDFTLMPTPPLLPLSRQAPGATNLLLLLSLLTGCPASNQDPGDSDADTSMTGDMGEADASDNPSRDMGEGSSTPDLGGAGTPDMPPDATMSCVETPLYTDADGDGQGGGESTGSECLTADESPSDASLVRQGGDCNDQDPLQYTGSSGICGDRVDDDCDEEDEKCPESQPASTLLPSWDCADDSPPDNVYAWARFEQGNTHINPGCFVFFAAQKDLFYVQRVGLDDTDSCQSAQGCICRYDGGNGYDQRLYAFTRDADASSCPDISLGDGDDVVSNGCRKYLYHMYNDSRGYSFAATGKEALEERLDAFSTVEVACVEDVTFPGSFPFQQLLTTTISFNQSFIMPD